jgi:hypothetical protein
LQGLRAGIVDVSEVTERQGREKLNGTAESRDLRGGGEEARKRRIRTNSEDGVKARRKESRR